MVVANERAYQRCAWTSRDHPAPVLKPDRTTQYPSQVLDQNFGAEHTTRDPAQAADWAARLQKRGFDSEVLHYRVPQSELDSLSGMAFPGPTPAWEDMVRSQRLLGGPAHGMDYVEGPMVGNVFGSWGGGPIDPWGNQVSFHTPGAASMLNRYIQ